MFVIQGGKMLEGELTLGGAKNSVLPILAASIISGCESRIYNCPDLSDVRVSLDILRHLGCNVSRQGSAVTVDASSIDRWDIPQELMRQMRSSVIFLGAILARTGSARMSRPGGCELGARPIDLHLAGMRSLGAVIREEGGEMLCSSPGLRGNAIDLAFPSVGATENIMIAACLAEGETLIHGAACEPEIEDLQGFLNAMGASVSGAGSSSILIQGGKPLHAASYNVMPDRIVAATYMSAVCAAGGSVLLKNARPKHLRAVIEVFDQAGCGIKSFDDRLEIQNHGRPSAVRHIRTGPYPGFPTDAQAPVMAALLKARGASLFVENIFENRFRHVSELCRMGADIRTEGRAAVVFGVSELTGAEVEAADLRGGAALIVAALSAEGESRVRGRRHIERGYENIAGDLENLGADIKRVEIP